MCILFGKGLLVSEKHTYHVQLYILLDGSKNVISNINVPVNSWSSFDSAAADLHFD